MKNLKIKFKLIYIPILLMMLGGALMIGLTDYLVASFSTEDIDSAWTSNIICTNVGIACMITAVILIRVDKFKEEDEDYNKSISYIYNYYNNDKYQTALFRKFCAIENDEIKKETYRLSMNKKFTKLKANPKDLHVYTYGTDEEKKNNKYCKMHKYYEELLSDKYINDNLDKMYIKHNTITESLVFSGVPTESSKLDYVTKHKVSKVFRDVSPKYLLTFSITIIVASLTIDLKDGITWVIIFKTAAKLFSICSQIYYAYNYSNKYTQEVVMHDINFRINIIKKYDLWLARKVEEVKE